MTSHNPYTTVTLNHPDGIPPQQYVSHNQQHQPMPPQQFASPTRGPGSASGGSGYRAAAPYAQQYAQQYAYVASGGSSPNMQGMQHAPPTANGAGVPPPHGAPMPRSPMVGGAMPPFFATASPHGSFSARPPLNDEARSERSVSSGGGSSAAQQQQHDVLPLCPDDNGCLRVNDRDHQKQYSHTCRLFPCFHAHLKYHTRFFRHAPGQAAAGSSEDGASSQGGKTPSNASTGSVSRTRAAKHRKQARKALSSVSFTHISPDVPNAQKIVVLHSNRAFEISGDWSLVVLHTFKRYLYQVTGVRPAAQIVKFGAATLTDEAASLSELGVTEGSQLIVDVDVSKTGAPTPAPIGDASAAAGGSAKIPVAWL